MTAAGNANLLDELRSPSLSPSLLQPLLGRLLSHPKIFNGFSDVLKYPSVRAALAKMDEAKRTALVKTVELFAFGTARKYFELREGGDEVWTLNDTQLEKLRMLSVVSLARAQVDRARSTNDDVEMDDGRTAARRRSKGKKSKRKTDNGMLSVPYAKLAAELRIPDDGTAYDEQTHVRPLEDLLIQCIYSNLVAAKLDQSTASLKLEPHVALAPESGGNATKGGKDGIAAVHGSLLSRDLDTSTPEATNAEVGRMISTIEVFLEGSTALLSTLEKSSKAMASDRTEDELRWREVQKVLDENPAKFREGGGGPTSMGMGTGGDPMEVVDLHAGGRRQVKRSRGGMGGEGMVRFR